MSDRIDDLLAELKKVSGPNDLDERILGGVRRSIFALRIRLATGYALLGGVGLALIWFARNLVAGFSQSSAGDLLQLAFTDPKTVAGNLSNWAIAVVESVPVEELLLVVSTLFLALLLVSRLAKWSAGAQHTARIAKRI